MTFTRLYDSDDVLSPQVAEIADVLAHCGIV